MTRPSLCPKAGMLGGKGAARDEAEGGKKGLRPKSGAANMQVQLVNNHLKNKDGWEENRKEQGHGRTGERTMQEGKGQQGQGH